MNVFRPQRCVLPGSLHCVYDLIRRDPITGERVSHGCCLHSGDFYNIYPEFDSSGDVVNQDPNPTVPNDLKLGPTVIWENITNMHQDGMSFDFRAFHADIHPLYHKEHRNVPVRPQEDEELTGEVFGSNSPVLVSTGWIEESYYGHDRVERCRLGIYGPFDEKANTTRPKCVKSYTLQIKDWTNFTFQTDWGRPKEFFAADESNAVIQDFCYRWFDPVVAERLAEGIIHIKNGGYVNLWTMMINNFVGEDQRRDFMNMVSLKSKSNLYSGSLNIEHYCRLYDQVDKMHWEHKYVDQDGNYVSKVIRFPDEIRLLYKQNILNFILNYPGLQNAVVGADEGYRTNERYWYAMMIFKRAIKEGVVNTRMTLPPWLVAQFRDTGKHDHIVELFGERKPYSQCTKQEKDDYLEAKIVRVPNAQDLYPRMERVEDIIDYHDKTLKWYAFCDILNAGRRWSRSEIQAAWEVFSNAWDHQPEPDPSIFWDWVDEIASRPLEDDISMDGTEIIYEGACRIDYGEGNITTARAFAANLIGLRTGCEEDSFEVNKMPVQNWYEVSGRTKPGLKRDGRKVFWDQLALCGGLEDDRWFEEHGMSANDFMEATGNLKDFHRAGDRGLAGFDTYESRGLAVLTGFSDSDFGHISIYDADNDELTPLREDLWQDKE